MAKEYLMSFFTWLPVCLILFSSISFHLQSPFRHLSSSPSPFNIRRSLGADLACLLFTLCLVILISFLHMLTNPHLHL